MRATGREEDGALLCTILRSPNTQVPLVDNDIPFLIRNYTCQTVQRRNEESQAQTSF